MRVVAEVQKFITEKIAERGRDKQKSHVEREQIKKERTNGKCEETKEKDDHIRRQEQSVEIAPGIEAVDLIGVKAVVNPCVFKNELEGFGQPVHRPAMAGVLCKIGEKER